MPELRGGLIGCGFFARNHMHAWNALPDAQIVAVCDTDLARAQTFAQDFNVPRTYTDAAQMFQAENLDFVDIVTQPATHRALVELAAAHGVPVICQKPLALTLEDAQAMVQACENANVPFMVHENFRWQSPMRVLKAAAADIGDLFFGRISFRTPYDVYANQPYLATETALHHRRSGRASARSGAIFRRRSGFADVSDTARESEYRRRGCRHHSAQDARAARPAWWISVTPPKARTTRSRKHSSIWKAQLAAARLGRSTALT